MAASHQPLLGFPKRSTIPACRSLFLTLSITLVISLTALVALHLTTHNHFQACAHAKNPTSCLAIIGREVVAGVVPMTEVELLQILIKRSLFGIKAASRVSLRFNRHIDQPGLADCVKLLDLSRGRLEDSSRALQSRTPTAHDDVHTWLSAVLTNHVTCLDGLGETAKSVMGGEMESLMAIASTSLAIINRKSSSSSSSSLPDYLEQNVLEPLGGEYPSWVTSKDRKLLQSSGNAITANVVVAKDGSGKYSTVQAALAGAPDNGNSRYVIYVKKGTYKENVLVGKKKKNVMLVGDGMELTIITGSLNVVDGSTTFNSATVVAEGDGFIAQDIWIQNTAGPAKHQAVALRVSADTSVINRCKLDAYQDTLYAHSLRQFYRDSSITGTVDFIFGNAAVVFQNCKIIARKPMSGQGNMLTAQGRTDPNQNTGTSIQKSEVIPSADLIPVKGSVKTFLGRPWKEYSRTVFMQSSIDNHIDPKGWSAWSGDFALKTLYYGEYANSGPGAGTSNRVNWPGYHVITNPNDANKFTVGGLIQGGQWLKATGVAYTEGL